MCVDIVSRGEAELAEILRDIPARRFSPDISEAASEQRSRSPKYYHLEIQKRRRAGSARVADPKRARGGNTPRYFAALGTNALQRTQTEIIRDESRSKRSALRGRASAATGEPAIPSRENFEYFRLHIRRAASRRDGIIKTVYRRCI